MGNSFFIKPGTSGLVLGPIESSQKDGKDDHVTFVIPNDDIVNIHRKVDGMKVWSFPPTKIIDILGWTHVNPPDLVLLEKVGYNAAIQFDRAAFLLNIFSLPLTLLLRIKPIYRKRKVRKPDGSTEMIYEVRKEDVERFIGLLPKIYSPIIRALRIMPKSLPEAIVRVFFRFISTRPSKIKNPSGSPIFLIGVNKNLILLPQKLEHQQFFWFGVPSSDKGNALDMLLDKLGLKKYFDASKKDSDNLLAMIVRAETE